MKGKFGSYEKEILLKSFDKKTIKLRMSAKTYHIIKML